jgi:hypothetical protein
LLVNLAIESFVQTVNGGGTDRRGRKMVSTYVVPQLRHGRANGEFRFARINTATGSSRAMRPLDAPHGLAVAAASSAAIWLVIAAAFIFG